jgi:hypothetical protein
VPPVKLEVVKVAVPDVEVVELKAEKPRDVVPSKKMTTPVGTLVVVTFAVNVTVVPYVTGP